MNFKNREIEDFRLNMVNKMGGNGNLKILDFE